MTPTEEKYKAMVMTQINEIVNKGKNELIKDLYADDVTYYDPFTEGKVGYGLAAITTFIVNTKTAFPDFFFEVENIMVKDDLVMWNGKATGTYLNYFAGLPPANGNKFEIPMCQIYKFKNGKVQTLWVFTDSLGLAMQLGALG